MPIMLTQQERNRFAEWLKEEVESEEMIIEQLSKFLGHAKFLEMKKQRSVACVIVASLLRSIEDG